MSEWLLMLYNVVMIHLISSNYFPRKNRKRGNRYCLFLIVGEPCWALKLSIH